MRNKYIIFALIMMFVQIEFLSANDSFADAVKFIKLSNTYRESKDYESAIKFLKRSKAAIETTKFNRESKYWLAAIDESYFYIFRDLGLIDEARKHLNSALAAFERIINQKDGSPLPLDLIRDNLKNLEYQNQLLKPETFGLNKIINLDNQKLKQVPSDLQLDLENLSMANNKLRDFPASLFQYKEIKYLNLSNNRIRNIQFDFANLNKLIWLNLSNNSLKTMQGNISELKQLQFLDLSGNALKNIPIGIAELKHLRILNIKGNKIPFEQISNLIRKLPNTNILYDEYILKGEEEDSDSVE